jgi:hypothetical protein
MPPEVVSRALDIEPNVKRQKQIKGREDAEGTAGIKDPHFLPELRLVVVNPVERAQ